MSLSEGLSAIDEGRSVKEDGEVSDFPHGHNLWSSGCPGWMTRGSGPMALAGLSPDLAQRPSFWPFHHI